MTTRNTTTYPAPAPAQNAALRALTAAQARFTTSNPLSANHHTTATASLPGGNTRTLLHTAPFPLTLTRGRGPHVWDADGHQYLDLVGELSAALYGHSHPTVHAAAAATLAAVGLGLGGTTVHEQRFAALLCARFRLGRVRFANSGTEANLHALAAARRYTGRRAVVVFSGGYHGAVLAFAGGVAAENAVDRGDFVVVERYNDLGLARAAIKGTEDLAAVLVEPMQGAGGCIVGGREFLLGVQEAAREKGAVFILDEVMTSRLAPGGLGVEMGLTPDLVVLGKYLGGGFAFGAFGGREEVMRVYDPRVAGALAHSGTFNNNTMVMCVGYAALEGVYTPEVNIEFNARGDRLRERLQEVARGTRLSFTGRGSLIGLHFTEDGTEEISCAEDICWKERPDLRDLFWFEMLEAGFWTTRRGFIALILETPDEELDGFVEAAKGFLGRHRDIMAVNS
ncbi:PLP-dependent transferase [Trichocladium antarcticum]|uniref:PLP-dependent transferase n=1 Tax=Trichocladium antarcticum TaxID=1450529 RepID=A0AAN6UNN7_9PEZI|nr:PLP-dependent transferase [Trichocladium antarcticum]